MFSPDFYHEILNGQRRNPLAVLARCGLRIATVPYSLVIGQRNRRYENGQAEIRRVSVPVISVGNITVGGTGKTPFVAWLARWFREQGVRVSLISRGYGASDGQRNDEAKELEARLPDVPHLQNADRVAAAQIAVEELATQLILLDDAFQHRRLHRDLDIVLLDATQPFGYGHLLPRGLLREPPRSLRRAHIVVLTRCDLVDASEVIRLCGEIQQLAPQAVLVQVAQRPQALLSASGMTRPVQQLVNQSILAFCGIGNPRAFMTTLDQLGAKLVDTRPLPDHYAYNASAMQQLSSWAAASTTASAAICTHKDLVKIASDRLGPLPLYALQTEQHILTGQEKLETKLHELLARIPSE